MKTPLLLLFLLGLATFVLAGTNPSSAKTLPPPDKPAAPKIEVCFVLDTTGSMGGLIEAAKQKIWSISNQIVKAKPTPELKVGLVAYRDRGDVYITKTFPLTDDIDTVYANLMKFQADGGGDEPESVNEALAVAVHKMDWSADDHVLKLLFLVGDAPPHMDYANDVKYPITCEEAVKRGIIINTVQCGNMAETTPDWKKIAALGEGHYTSIAEDGGIAVIASPMDAKLAELNSDVGKTIVPYGEAAQQHEVLEKQAVAESSFSVAAATPAAADRLAYNVSTGKAVQGQNELVNDYEKDKDVVGKITADQLPPELKDKKPEELKAYLDQQSTRRAELQKQIGELSKEREAYIADARKKMSGKADAFDEEVAKILREEMEKKGLSYN